MKRWFLNLESPARAVGILACFVAAMFLVGNGVGLMMGDPFTEEAREIQRRWAPLAFFLGCPAGFALAGLGLAMVVWSWQSRKA